MACLQFLRALALGAASALVGCSAVNEPVNRALGTVQNASLVDPALASKRDDTVWVGLAFSGGGMRASAFAHGMLEGRRLASATTGNPYGILSDVRLVTGVSRGSVTAAKFGLFGPGGVSGFREKFLIREAEKYMANAPLNPVTLVRGLSGGANGTDIFGRFLDETLFDGATFGDLRRRSAIRTWINANNVAFLFSPETFDAPCSDLGSFPLSQAVAFPLVFSPIVLEAHAERCDDAEPDWLTAARHNPEATSAMRTDLNAIPTRLALETGQVDLAIRAGQIATRGNPELNGFRRATVNREMALADSGPARRIVPVRN